MNKRTLENNYKFLSDKQTDLLSLYRLACRDAWVSSDAHNGTDFDIDDFSRVYTEFCGDNVITPCLELAIFCSEFARMNESLNLTFIDDSDSNEIEIDHLQIAYLKNAFSDRAYRRFSEKYDKISASYFAGFREVCEEVYYGRCSYAILPIYSSSDGQLPSFRQLISKYDLNIICAVDIEMSDEGYMRYALLKKGLTDSINRDSISYLDLSVVTESDFKIGEFLSSCEYLGAKILSTYSFPSEYSEDSNLLYLTLDVSGCDIRALYLFFECSHIRYNPIGKYSII